MQFYLPVEFQHAKVDSVYADDINSNSEYLIILWSIWACDPMKQFNLIEKALFWLIKWQVVNHIALYSW